MSNPYNKCIMATHDGQNDCYICGIHQKNCPKRIPDSELCDYFAKWEKAENKRREAMNKVNVRLYSSNTTEMAGLVGALASAGYLVAVSSKEVTDGYFIDVRDVELICESVCEDNTDKYNEKEENQ